MGRIWVDAVTLVQALDRIRQLVDAGEGGSVFTPNVDHVVRAERHAEFASAYASANLSVVDGKALQWACQIAGTPVPEKVSGSDLVIPLMEMAGRLRWRVFFVGASPAVAAAAARVVRERYAVDVVGTASPFIPEMGDPGVERSIDDQIRQTRAQLMLVAFGAPKQELFIARRRQPLAPAVAVGVGASLDFLAGRVSRAPHWISDAGLEWLYRLAQEPRRLWRRYLVDDARFPLVLARTMREPRAERVQGAR